MPFVLTQYKRAMTKVVTEAKGAIEGFVNHKITQLGIKSLRQIADADPTPKLEVESPTTVQDTPT